MVSTACFVASELRVVPIVTTVDAMRPSVIEHPNTDTISTPVLFLVSGIGLQLRMSVVAVPGCWPGLWVEPVGRAPTSGGCVCIVPWQGGGGGQGDEPNGSPSTTQHGEAELVPLAPVRCTIPLGSVSWNAPRQTIPNEIHHV